MPDILILDDDVLLRELMAETLRDEGLEVLTAGDTQTAMELLDEFGARVLVADKRLDTGRIREDGHVLADMATHRFPTLSVVYISGEPGALANRGLDPRERALPKPFISTELVAVVKDVMAWGNRPFAPSILPIRFAPEDAGVEFI